jgi:hypothetical protein
VWTVGELARSFSWFIGSSAQRVVMGATDQPTHA